jgi:hypothetical protein
MRLTAGSRFAVTPSVERLSGDRRYPDEPRFPALRSITRVEAEVGKGGETTRTIRYYLSSAPLSPPAPGAGRPRPLGFENSLHRVLDVVVNEDRSRLRTGDGARNMASSAISPSTPSASPKATALSRPPASAPNETSKSSPALQPVTVLPGLGALRRSAGVQTSSWPVDRPRRNLSSGQPTAHLALTLLFESDFVSPVFRVPTNVPTSFAVETLPEEELMSSDSGAVEFDDLVDLKTVCRALCRSRASIYRDVGRGSFPKPVRSSDLRAFIAAAKPSGA